MESDVREALRNLTTSLESHLEAIVGKGGSDDLSVDDTYEALAEAFERYSDLLDIEYGEELPIVLDDEDDDEDELDDVEQEDPDDFEDDDVEPHEEDGEVDDLEEFSLREE